MEYATETNFKKFHGERASRIREGIRQNTNGALLGSINIKVLLQRFHYSILLFCRALLNLFLLYCRSNFLKIIQVAILIDLKT